MGTGTNVPETLADSSETFAAAGGSFADELEIFPDSSGSVPAAVVSFPVASETIPATSETVATSSEILDPCKMGRVPAGPKGPTCQEPGLPTIKSASDRTVTSKSTGIRPMYNRHAIDISLLAVRLAVGIIFAAHGSQKVFGLFGGPGLTNFVEMMNKSSNVGAVAYLVAIGECFGGLGIIFGFLSRFSAASIIVIMIGAIYLEHGKNGFFMAKGGFEYNIALIGLLIPILLLGPGSYAIGRFLPLPKSAKTGRPIIVLE
jgi:putative oxidoreductase